MGLVIVQNTILLSSIINHILNILSQLSALRRCSSAHLSVVCLSLVCARRRLAAVADPEDPGEVTWSEARALRAPQELGVSAARTVQGASPRGPRRVLAEDPDFLAAAGVGGLRGHAATGRPRGCGLTGAGTGGVTRQRRRQQHGVSGDQKWPVLGVLGAQGGPALWERGQVSQPVNKSS